MSEVDVAVRRAQAALRRRQIKLTGAEWARDEAHRRDRAACPQGPDGMHCDDPAHWYRMALQLYAFVEAGRAEGWQPAMVKDGEIKVFDLE